MPRVECVPADCVDDRDYVAAIGLIESVGFFLDDWQKRALRYSLSMNVTGHWSASKVCLSVPRQSGKTLLAAARELYALFSLPPKSLIIHSAHLYPTATESFRYLAALFAPPQDGFPAGPLHGHEKYVHDWSGDQSIEMKNGTRIKYSARGRGQLRGVSCDLLVLDEVQQFPAESWADVLPTVSARPNSQIWLMGTPPAPEHRGEVFASIRDLGHKGDDDRLYYGEFSATRDMDPGDPVTWAVALPALGTRIREDTVRGEFLSMRDQMIDKFWRERLGVWDEGIHAALFDMGKWDSQAVDEAPDFDSLCYAVDMNPDRTRVTVGVAARAGDRVHVETVRSEPVSFGFDWLLDFLEERRKRGGVVIDGQSPIASLLPELKARKVDLTLTNADLMRKACGAFFDAYQLNELSHYSGDLMLSQALMGAEKKLSGDGGAFVWNRKNYEVDITSLVAATLAFYGLTAVKRKTGRATFI